jgi:hypothetical protein
MTQLLDCLKAIGRSIKAWILLNDTLEGLTLGITVLQDSADKTEKHINSIDNTITVMNKYGTEGSQASLKDLHGKVDLMGLQLAKIETIVSNGHNGKCASGEKVTE